MKTPRTPGLPAKPEFKVPDAAPLTNFDPFALAKQFDQMRSGAGMAAPTAQPITYSGSISQSPSGGAQPAFQGPQAHGATGAIGNALRLAGTAAAGAASDWGSRTTGFQQAFPSLRQTSGYRDPERNARTPGASPTSYHMQRDAQGNSRANDYVGSAKDMSAAAAYAKANGAKEVLIHNAGTGQHLHVAWS